MAKRIPVEKAIRTSLEIEALQDQGNTVGEACRKFTTTRSKAVI